MAHLQVAKVHICQISRQMMYIHANVTLRNCQFSSQVTVSKITLLWLEHEGVLISLYNDVSL